MVKSAELWSGTITAVSIAGCGAQINFAKSNQETSNLTPPNF